MPQRTKPWALDRRIRKMRAETEAIRRDLELRTDAARGVLAEMRVQVGEMQAIAEDLQAERQALAARDDEIRTLRAGGMPPAQVAAQFGMTVAQVNKIVQAGK